VSGHGIHKKFFKFFANDIEKKLAASLQKIQLATKAQRHEVEKMQSIFPLCLRDFVAKFIFCKKNVLSLFSKHVISSLSKPGKGLK
jgi:hypothetical protein